MLEQIHVKSRVDVKVLNFAYMCRESCVTKETFVSGMCVEMLLCEDNWEL